MNCPICNKIMFAYNPKWGGICSHRVIMEDGQGFVHYKLDYYSENNNRERIIIPHFQIINKNNISKIYTYNRINNEPTFPYIFNLEIKVPRINIYQPDLLLRKIKTILAFS